MRPADSIGGFPGAAGRRIASVPPRQVLLEPRRQHEPVRFGQRRAEPSAGDGPLSSGLRNLGQRLGLAGLVEIGLII
jgi:hypothetical protein